MSSEALNIERLESGIQAAFITMPHFRTHSARIVVNAGSVHETPDAFGAAHFLEHVVFQGTKAMPTEASVHQYQRERGLNKNAYTNQMQTCYWADGYELESVGTFTTQLALNPLLKEEALEGERKPIVDELLGYASNPYYEINMAHGRAIRGETYARSVIGTLEDIRKISPEALREFHNRHYQLGNMLLVFCSPEPIEQQREIAEQLTAEHIVRDADTPQPVELGVFNPNSLTSSLQQVDLPTTQATVSLSFDLPEASTLDEHFSYNVLGGILSHVAHDRLRRELALCYGASASVGKLVDLSFGRNKSWGQLAASANLNSQDSLTGLQSLRDDVFRRPIPETAFAHAILSMQRDIDHLMQSTPSQIADRVKDLLTSYRRDSVDLTEAQDFAGRLSIDKLRKMQKDLTDTKPLVIATSSDPKTLDAIGEWAESQNP